MNVLFISLEIYRSINDHNLYTDLLRKFAAHGHKVYSISPIERRMNENTELIEEKNSKILRLRIGNMQKTNLIEKGISTITIEKKYIDGIKKYFGNVRFDLVLYATPPITFCSVIEFVKQRDNAKSYLMLKDIFPQNAVDLDMISKKGLTSIIYKYFRYKEKRLYKISNYIGCMSPANVQYLLENNPEISSNIVGLCPNCIEVIDKSVPELIKKDIRKKYEIPEDKVTFIYGGNLGKPQGIDYLIDCMKEAEVLDVFFVIVGSGTERFKLEEYIKANDPKNVKLISQLGRDEYDSMVGSCDVGVICLDHRFTIPNFPSRLLSYMQASMPVLAMTDLNTDIGRIIQENGFGWWCESNSVDAFKSVVEVAKNSDRRKMGQKSWDYLVNNYDVEKQYHLICEQISLV